MVVVLVAAALHSGWAHGKEVSEGASPVRASAPVAPQVAVVLTAAFSPARLRAALEAWGVGRSSWDQLLPSVSSLFQDFWSLPLVELRVAFSAEPATRWFDWALLGVQASQSPPAERQSYCSTLATRGAAICGPSRDAVLALAPAFQVPLRGMPASAVGMAKLETRPLLRLPAATWSGLFRGWLWRVLGETPLMNAAAEQALVRLERATRAALEDAVASADDARVWLSTDQQEPGLWLTTTWGGNSVQPMSSDAAPSEAQPVEVYLPTLASNAGGEVKPWDSVVAFPVPGWPLDGLAALRDPLARWVGALLAFRGLPERNRDALEQWLRAFPVPQTLWFQSSLRRSVRGGEPQAPLLLSGTSGEPDAVLQALGGAEQLLSDPALGVQLGRLLGTMRRSAPPALRLTTLAGRGRASAPLFELAVVERGATAQTPPAWRRVLGVRSNPAGKKAGQPSLWWAAASSAEQSSAVLEAMRPSVSGVGPHPGSSTSVVGLLGWQALPAHWFGAGYPAGGAELRWQIRPGAGPHRGQNARLFIPRANWVSTAGAPAVRARQ